MASSRPASSRSECGISTKASKRYGYEISSRPVKVGTRALLGIAAPRRLNPSVVGIGGRPVLVTGVVSSGDRRSPGGRFRVLIRARIAVSGPTAAGGQLPDHRPLAARSNPSTCDALPGFTPPARHSGAPSPRRQCSPSTTARRPTAPPRSSPSRCPRSSSRTSTPPPTPLPHRSLRRPPRSSTPGSPSSAPRSSSRSPPGHPCAPSRGATPRPSATCARAPRSTSSTAPPVATAAWCTATTPKGAGTACATGATSAWAAASRCLRPPGATAPRRSPTSTPRCPTPTRSTTVARSCTGGSRRAPTCASSSPGASLTRPPTPGAGEGRWTPAPQCRPRGHRGRPG